MDRSMKSVWSVCILLSAVAALAVWTLKPVVGQIAFPPDQGPNWYLWKLPDPTFWTRATAWGGYILHQVFFLGCILWGMKHKDRLKNWQVLHPLNIVMLGGTAFFILLHYLQTMIFFDGLAQDVPVAWSQGSVVVMLAILVLMEAPRRGFFFGIGKTWFKPALPFLYKTHGYYAAWATVFTFWYHPMFPTWGHVTGFFYMYLLFLQICLIFTRVHMNKYWTVTLEVLVVAHAVVMASINAPDMWQMFGFGFMGMFVATQMYGLGLSKRALSAIWVAYAVAAVVVFSQVGFDKLMQITWIPVILFAFAALMGFIIMIFVKLGGQGKPKTAQA